MKARIAFHGELAELPARRRFGSVVDYPVTRRASLKDVIEALGVPHTEVYGLVVDGSGRDFKHLLSPAERVDVYPAEPPVDPTVQTRLRPVPLSRIAFVVDDNVARLGELLRLLGLDAAAEKGASDERIAQIADHEGRIVLSRDMGLMKRSKIVWGRLVRANAPWEQLREVVSFFAPGPPFAPFTRCLQCNVPLEAVDKEEVQSRLEPKTRKYFHEFSICPSCGRIFWPGSHHDFMHKALASMDLI